MAHSVERRNSVGSRGLDLLWTENSICVFQNLTTGKREHAWINY